MVKTAMKKKTPQARSTLGGTLIGFVLGLLVGLGVALAVAVYVTRVPIPFVDRGVSRNSDLDALEAERNKGWNPNSTLGRTPPAAGAAAVQAPPPAAAVPPAGQAGSIVVPPADGRPLPAPTRDPLGELMQSRTGQAPAPAPAASAPVTPGADPFTYFVQAGAFRSQDDAEAQRAKLAMLGIDAAITEREQSGRTVYRVRVGPFTQKALAELTQEQLNVNGVEAGVVRVQR